MRVITSNILVWMVTSFISTSANIPREMETLIDNRVQPCDNYYKYACGNWLKTHKDSVKKVDLAMDKIEENRRKVLDNVVQDKHKQLRDLWDSCMALSDTKRNGVFRKAADPGIEALLHDLDRVSHVKSHRDIMKLAGEFSRSRTFAFFEHSVEAGGKDYNTYRLYMRPAKLTLKDTEYRDMHRPYSGNPHYKYIEALFKLTFKDQLHLIDRLHISKPEMCGHNICKGFAADNVIEMEKKLQKIKGQNLGSSQQLLFDRAANRWPNTVGAFLEGMGPNKISHVAEIYFEDVEYFNKLEMMITTIQISELKPLLAFVLIHSRASWLGDDFVRIWDEKIRGTTPNVNRHQFCQDRVVELLPSLVGSIFTRMAFDFPRRKYAKDMVDLVVRAMELHTQESKWMSDEEKTEAKYKLSKMETMIAEPPVTASFLTVLHRDNYYKNVQNILEYRYYHDQIKISKKVKVQREAWPQSPALAEAKYDPHMNSVMFPTAMMQPPFFHGKTVHPARDFGAMGPIMGREISRGFDHTGSRYGRLGNQRDWWSEATKMNYKQASFCMVDQYSSFEGHDHNADAVETRDQNLVDARGIALAWNAYKTYMAFIKRYQHTIPDDIWVSAEEGEKLFFLSFAQSMCSHTPRGLPSESSEYAPPEWRVNGALMNLDQFHTVYGCKAPRKMVPKQKCDLW